MFTRESKIKPKPFYALTQDVYNRFCGRKGLFLLSVIVDVEKGLVYPVPETMEHIDFACKILRITLKEFLEYRQDFIKAIENLVPSNIEIDPTTLTVVGIGTGISGMELGYGIRHTEEQLVKAHAIVKEFVENGDFPVNLRVDKISFKFKRKAA